MIDYIELLEKVLIKPDVVYNTGSKKLWDNFEKELGLVLPDDYKKIIERFGTGGIENFIWFLTPFEGDDNINFIKKCILCLMHIKHLRIIILIILNTMFFQTDMDYYHGDIRKMVMNYTGK